ncbi:hypothetical protein Q757_00390 [Oenococcus alcoholitolerans]|uniref:Initiator Rep protein WH1 domain-containing protein n=1 Tax=Oenococcus alcoholitolerans TaxID=931074 RepID=A0ABR4XSU7_9LACO|nr:hypothetical protein Q757_00390 [Oenococcus alcoholitolerans]
MKKKKAELAIQKLLSRQDYLIVQANDLARAFGNLSSFEHKILDYCFSFVTEGSKTDDAFKANCLDIIRHMGLVKSGTNYERIIKAFRALNEKTALYFEVNRNGKRGILMTQLFDHIEFLENGQVEFSFSRTAAPYVFALRKNYYSFKLSQLAVIKSKYSLILLKLWEANRQGKNKYTEISGSLEEWQEWFLGKERRWPSGRFKRDALELAIKEIETKSNAECTLTTVKNGRSVVGYQLQINDLKVVAKNG